MDIQNNQDGKSQEEIIQKAVSHVLHEVRNPLNTISINAELGKLLLQRNGDVEKVIQVFDTILNECRSCGTKLNELKQSAMSLETEGHA